MEDPVNNSWDVFIHDNLLATGLVDGACLITHQAVPVYSYGILHDLPEENWHQFLFVFQYATPKNDTEVSNRGFELHQRNGKVLKFSVYQKTFNSVCSFGEGERSGLLVSNLPYGILLTTYHRPNDTGTVVEAVEKFCQKLRR